MYKRQAMITPASGGIIADIRDRKDWNIFRSPIAANTVPAPPATAVVTLKRLSSKPNRLLRARPPE